MKKKLRIAIQYTLLLLVAAAITAGVMWARWCSQGERCTGLTVEIVNSDSTAFVNSDGVLATINLLNINPKGKLIHEINTQNIETLLERSDYLEDVQCTINHNTNHVRVRARQMLPVLRVFDGNDSYYVNRGGKHINAQGKYHIDVPVVQGHFTKEYPATRLLPLIEYIEADEELNSLVTMYSVRDSNNIYLVPCISGHVINLGDDKNLPDKFEKLRKFYREVMPKRGWLTYDTITLKWNNRVVASRRKKIEIKEEQYDSTAFSIFDSDSELLEAQTGAQALAGAPE